MSNKLSEKARQVAERAKGESENLNVAIAALAGALLAESNDENLDLSEENIFVDSSNDNLNEAVIQYLTFTDGELVYGDDDNDEDTSVDALPLDTRIELAEKLADLLEA
jgi:hypothetical protein